MSQPSPGPGITLLERREIEARIAGPLIRAFEKEIGAERTHAVVRATITELARDSGAALAAQLGETTLTAFATCLETWNAGDAIEMTMLEQSPQRLSFDVTRCRFAELYQSLGMADLGYILSCHRDFGLIEGFNPAIRLSRDQTIMEGRERCPFRFRDTAVADPAT